MHTAFLVAKRIEGGLVEMGTEIVLVGVRVEGLFLVEFGIDRVGLLVLVEKWLM
jgi:hypothetical protein